MQREGFWTCLIDGVLWLMYGEHRVAQMATTVEQLEEALKKVKEKEVDRGQ